MELFRFGAVSIHEIHIHPNIWMKTKNSVKRPGVSTVGGGDSCVCWCWGADPGGGRHDLPAKLQVSAATSPEVPSAITGPPCQPPHRAWPLLNKDSIYTCLTPK